MIEALGLALMATFFTFLFITVVIGCLLLVAYTLDHWNDGFGDSVKAIIIGLLVFLTWWVFFTAKAYYYPKEKAEVEDVRAS